MPFTMRNAPLLCLLFLAVGVEQCLGFTAFPPATIRRHVVSNVLTIPQEQRHLQQQQTQMQLHMFRLDGKNNNGQQASEEYQIPYIIEKISDRPNERIFKEVAEVCINVFFKEQLDAKPEDRVPPWKEAQISYLKTLQTGDLKIRRRKYQQRNEMFLAYEVIPATSANTMNQPLILDTTQNVYNLKNLGGNEQGDYVRGRLLGFCEVTQRQYGLGNEAEEGSETLRPVLTNLAVAADARQYGIGSKLVDECEKKAGIDWKMKEIVLEVEDYNDKALNFYLKRGYSVVFCDPASRRFDVGGIMLKKVRCTRQILRKSLSLKRAQLAGQDSMMVGTFGFFERFRPTVSV